VTTRSPEPLAGLRPETELLLRTSRPPRAGARSGDRAPTEGDRAPTEGLRALLRRKIDWELLLRTAEAHGTLPLLHWHLNEADGDVVPAAVWSALHEAFHRNAGLNLWRTGELLRLLDRLEQRGVAAIPFKGPTLAAYAYGSLSLRRFLDLDLLVRPADLPAAGEVLRGEGYVPGLGLPPDRQRSYLEAIGQLPFWRPGDASLVELHTRLMPRHYHFPLGVDELARRLETLPLQGRQVRVLSAEDLLLVLCGHGAKHLFALLSWVADVAALVTRRPPPDLALALERARGMRCERIVLLGLRLAYDLLGELPPPDVERPLRADPAAGNLAVRVWRRLVRGGGEGTPEGVREALFHLQSRERFRDGAAYALSLALQPAVADWEWVALPPAASFLYYFLRPVRLAGKYGFGGLVSALRRSKTRHAAAGGPLAGG
jgi:hypothetical protein